MTDFASLGLSVDSRPVADATKALDEMGASAAALEPKVQSAVKSTEGLATSSANVWRRGGEASKVIDSLGDSSARAGQRISVSNGQMADTARIMAAQADQARATAAANMALGTSADKLTLGQQHFIDSLKTQAATVGMSRTQLLAYQAAELGVTEQTKALIEQIQNASKAQAGHAAGMGSSLAKMEALRVVHDAMIGSYTRMGSSLFVLGNATGVTTALFSAAAAPILAVVAAVGLFAYAAYKGTSESDAFNKSLQITGNFAGVTEGQFNSMARSMADSEQMGIGSARTALQGLISTGQFTGESLVAVGGAAMTMSRLTGESAEDVTKEFAKMADGVVKFVDEHEKQYHALSTAQYQHIRQLEEEGKAQEAMTEYGRAVDTALKKNEENLGTLGKALKAGKLAWSDFWDSAFDVGRKKGPQDDIEKYKGILEHMDAQPGWLSGKDQGGGAQKQFDESRMRIVQALTAAAIEENNAQAAANAKAAEARRHAEGEDGVRQIADMHKRYQDKATAEKAEIKAYNDAMAKVAADGGKVDSADEQAKVIAGIHKQYAERAAAGSDASKSMLSGQLADIKASVEAEKARYEQLNKLDEMRHKAGEQTDKDYYDNKRARFDAMSAVEVAGYDSQLASLRAFHGKTAVERQDNANKILAELAAQSKAVQKYQDESQALYVEAWLRSLEPQKKIDAAMTERLKKLTEEADKLEATNRAHGKSKSVLDDEAIATNNLAIAVEREAIARLGEYEGSEADIVLRQKRIQLMLDENAQLERSGKALDQKAFFDANDKAAAEAAKAWKHTANTIEADLTNAILDGGGRGWKKLVHDMEYAFARMILSPILSPISSGIASFVNPAGGLANAAGASSAISSGSNIMGLLNGTSSALTIGGSTTAASFLSGIGAGAGIGGTGNAAMMASAATSGNLAAGASFGGSIGSAIAAIPGWGWAALGAAAIGAYLLNDGPEQNTRLGFTSNNTPGNISINERGNEGKSNTYIDPGVSSAFGTFGVNSSFWMSSSSPTVTSFLDTVAKTDDALASFLTVTEKASVSSYLTGKESVAHMGAEGSDPNANGALDRVFAERINNILTGVEPGLASLVSGFKGTSQQLATEAANLLQYRSALRDAGEAVFGVKVTLQDIAALKTPTESTSAALTRVTGEFNATNAVAAALGKTAEQAFGTLGLASEGARAQLILAAGGISALQQNTASFAQNFLSDAERLAPAAKAMASTFAAMGVTMPDTRDQFKALVMGLDLTTQQGAATYASLMSVQDAFAQLHPLVSGAADNIRTAADIASERSKLQDQFDQLTMSSTQLLDKQRAALDAANRPLFDMVQAAQKLADTSSNMAKFRDAAQSLHDGLLTGSLSTLTPEQQYAELRRQYEQTKSAALGGDVTAQGNVAAALNSFLTASQKINGGDSQYAQDFAMGQQDSAGMAQWASGQVDSAQAQLAAMNMTNSILTNIAKGITNLPAAIASTPAVVMPAPALNYVASGAVSMEAVATEVKALRTALSAFHADANKNTGNGIVANDQSNQANADAIVTGVTAAVNRVASRNYKLADLLE